MTGPEPTLDQVCTYLNAAGWQQQAERRYNAQRWCHPGYDGGILVYDQDVDERGQYPVYKTGLLELLADHEGRCEHEVLADMLGEMNMATALAEIERLREENAAFRAGMVPRTLALGLACVNCHKCVGVFVTQEILDTWARDNGWRDGWCPDCLARPDTCERCGGIPCSECGECPGQLCRDCRCGRRDRDEREREGKDDD